MNERRPRGIALTTIVLTLLAALLIGACGGSRSSSGGSTGSTSDGGSNSTSTGTQTAPAVAVSGHASDSNIAVVNGTPITFGTYQHWLTASLVSAQENKTASTLPLWPPDFSACIASARKNIAKLKTSSTATLKKDCQQEFSEVNTDTLDFLIEGVWFQDYGKAHGVNVTSAEVTATFDKEKKASFKTAAAFNAYLKQNGETQADLVFRTEVNLYFRALVTKAEGSGKQTTKTQQAAEEKVVGAMQTAYKAKTVCATGYATSFCAS